MSDDCVHIYIYVYVWTYKYTIIQFTCHTHTNNKYDPRTPSMLYVLKPGIGMPDFNRSALAEPVWPRV